MHCENGAYYDTEQKMISITREDLPNLKVIGKDAFKNNEQTQVETFYIHNNPKLTAIITDTRYAVIFIFFISKWWCLGVEHVPDPNLTCGFEVGGSLIGVGGSSIG